MEGHNISAAADALSNSLRQLRKNHHVTRLRKRGFAPACGSCKQAISARRAASWGGYVT